MHSMEPARSSTVAIAQALPCLVILRWRPEMMPPMVTTAPSACSPPGELGDGGVRLVGRGRAPGRRAGGRRRRGRASPAPGRADTPCPTRSSVNSTSSPKPGARWSSLVAHAAEEVELPLGLLALDRDHVVDHRLVVRGEALAGVPHRVERAGLDQRFHGALVADDRLDLVEVVGEGAVLRPWPCGTRMIESTTFVPTLRTAVEAEEDHVVALGGEVGRGLVDVRREHLDAHAPALVQVDRRLVLVVARPR